MPRCTVLIIFFLGFLALASAMPQDDKNEGTYLFGLPFLQLTNGGIRVNFGGYHAQAGLGGLLGDSRTGGGLHASAGTPWGAHASAGLGGALGGDDATAGGGLYARAGLGNGRPEAAAGLGGILDGSGRSNTPIIGGLYAGASPGGYGDGYRSGTNANAGANAGGAASASASASANAAVDTGKSNTGRSTIQIIQRSDKLAEKSKQIDGAASGSEREISSFSSKGMRREADHQPPVFGVEAGLYGAVFADGTKQKVKVKNGEIEEVGKIPEAPPAPVLVNHVSSTNSQSEGADTVKVTQKPRRTRWSIKKRFWAGSRRKQINLDSESDRGTESEGSH